MSILILLALIALALSGVGFTVFVFGRVVYFLSLDGIEIYTRAHSAIMDADTRQLQLNADRAKFDYWREFAEMRIEQNRQKMLTGGDR